MGLFYMKEEKEQSVLAALLKDAYEKVFLENWPSWLGGVLIGIVSIIVFAWARPWGVVAGIREWFDWLFYGIGIYDSHPAENPLKSWASVLTLGLLWGAFASALLSKQFTLKVPPPFEMLRSVAGGIMMGIGSAMAAGCNVGGFFSATSALSLGGLAMMAGLLVGVFLEVHYYYWEVEHLRFKRGEGKPLRRKGGARDRKRLQPYQGAVVLAAVFVAVLIYRSLGVDAVTGYDYTVTGGLLVAGVAFGIIVHRSRFAFLQGFREPFISGRADQARGMAIAVIISVLGFAALKASGLRFEGDYVAPTFWVGGFAGGVIFGFGMPFAGGCASGTCWRSAEGSIKLVIAFVFMGITNSLCSLAIESSETLRSILGNSVFLPEYISYLWTVILIVTIMSVYYIVMSWNEKTGKFI
jgi:uncharacterized membrane protein YedE/YeeE